MKVNSEGAALPDWIAAGFTAQCELTVQLERSRAAWRRKDAIQAHNRSVEAHDAARSLLVFDSAIARVCASALSHRKRKT